MCYKFSRNICEIAGILRYPDITYLSSKLSDTLKITESEYWTVAPMDEVHSVFAKNDLSLKLKETHRSWAQGSTQQGRS